MFVRSSNLRSVSFDIETSTLTVQFVSGPVYVYYSVSSIIYRWLMFARSKGRYFDMHIKKGGYRYQRVM